MKKILSLPVLMGKYPFAHLLIPIDLISRYLARVCVCPIVLCSRGMGEYSIGIVCVCTITNYTISPCVPAQ